MSARFFYAVVLLLSSLCVAPNAGFAATLNLIAPPAESRRLSVWQPELFVWERFDGATAYELVLTQGAKEDKVAVTHKSQVEPTDPVSKQPRDPFTAVQLSPGKEYTWHVTALRDKKVIAQSSPRTLTTQKEVFEAAKQAGFRLQRAFTLLNTPEKADPATFGLSGAKGEGTVYATEFALGWAGRVKPNGDYRFTPAASVEARLHSHGDDKKTDALKARLTAQHDWRHSDTFFSYALTSLKYETSRKADTKKLLAELLYTPTFGSIGEVYPPITHYTGFPVRGSRPVTFTWRPYLGVDIGRTLETGDALEEDRTLLRGVARLSARLGLVGLAEQLNIPEVAIFADNYFRYLPREDSKRGNNYLETGIDFFLNESMSIAFRYNVGRDAPTFTFDRTFSANLGVRF